MLPVPKVIKQLLLNTIYLLEGERERQWERDWSNLCYVLTILIRQITRELTATTYTTYTLTLWKRLQLCVKNHREHINLVVGGREGGNGGGAWLYSVGSKEKWQLLPPDCFGTFCHVNAMFSMLLLSVLFSSSSSCSSWATFTYFAGIL